MLLEKKKDEKLGMGMRHEQEKTKSIKHVQR